MIKIKRLVSTVCGVAAFGVALFVATYLITGLVSEHTQKEGFDIVDSSSHEAWETTVGNKMEFDLPVDDVVYINEVATIEDAASHWIALGEFTPMTEREVLDYFGISVDFESLFSDLFLQKMDIQHGFHSRLDGTLLPKDSFVYCNEEKKISVVISIQDSSVQDYRLFKPVANSVLSSKIAGNSVDIFGWQENGLQAFECRFNIESISCSIETRNLPVNEVVLITSALLSQIDNP